MDNLYTQMDDERRKTGKEVQQKITSVDKTIACLQRFIGSFEMLRGTVS